METNEKLIDLLGALSSCDLSETLELPYAYKSYYSLVNRYQNYSILDLINLCKIDRLLELRIIPEDIHRSLKELYKMRIELFEKLDNKLDIDENEMNLLSLKIDKIDSELNKYNIDIYNMNFRMLLDSTIKDELFDRNINGERTKELIKEIKD